MRDTPKSSVLRTTARAAPSDRRAGAVCAPRAESTDRREASLAELLADRGKTASYGAVTTCFAWPSLARQVSSLLFLRPNLVSLGAGMTKLAP